MNKNIIAAKLKLKQISEKTYAAEGRVMKRLDLKLNADRQNISQPLKHALLFISHCSQCDYSYQTCARPEATNLVPHKNGIPEDCPLPKISITAKIEE